VGVTAFPGEEPTVSQAARSTSFRWQIAALLTVAIAISYFDRQTLAVAIAAIQNDIPITNTQFSTLNAAFLVAYALMYAGGGKLIDALGTRRGFLLIMVWWSLACMSHGLATGFVALAMSRFLLGMGEGGGFPAATKAVAEWFPVNQRSSAMGMINAGTAVGAVAAPPLIAIVLSLSSWRAVFFVTGAFGLIWTVWWYRGYRSPATHPRLSEEERALLVIPDEEEAGRPISWIGLFSFPQTWGLVIGKFLSDAAWYFYIFWLPKYLYDARGFDIKQVGYFAWIPYAAAGVGALLGGWYSSHLLRRGHSVNFSRKLTLGLSAAVMPFIIFVTKSPIELTIVLFSLAFFGQQSWSTLVMILPTDLFPNRVVASVAGLVGFGGAMGGVVFNLVAGRMLDAGSGYGPVFAAVSTFHVLAFLLILLTVRRVEPVELRVTSPVPQPAS
jgi:ACS family hexuronate transporter-like MFS transporter